MTISPSIRIHFSTQLYRSGSDENFQRLLDGLEKNLDLPFIDRATIFLDGCEPPWQRSDVRFVSHSGRASFADFLELMNSNFFGLGLPASHLLFANSDIVFDQSLGIAAQSLNNCKLNNAICLTRREVNGDYPKGIDPLQTQDAWMLPQQRLSLMLLDQLRGIQLGIAGCEHLLAAALLAHGFNLWNPCEDFLAVHTDPKPLSYAPNSERYWGFYVYVPVCRVADIGHAETGVCCAFSRAPGRYLPVSIG